VVSCGKLSHFREVQTREVGGKGRWKIGRAQTAVIRSRNPTGVQL